MYCHMKKRIKKDLTLRWPVRINGQEGNLNTLPGLKLELIDPRLQSTFPPFTTDGNVIVFRLRPEMQTAIGDYKLTLWCNYGSECQSCVDKSKAVTLVHSTEQESNQDTSSSVVVNETIALQGGDIEVDMSLINHTHRANDVFYGNKSVAEKLDELEIAEGNLSAHISATDQSLANEEIRAKAAERANAASLNNFMQDLNEVMPVSASAQNQLADKNFVNSSVATNTANFVGTFNTLNDLETVPSPTNNDYGFVVSTDQDGNVVYRRYKYSVRDNEWLFEYALNNSSFTAAQWASIQSGITAALVAKLIGLPTNSELMALLSSYLLKSGGTLTGNLNLNISGRSNNVLYASDNRELVRFGDNGMIIGNANINLRLQTAPNGKLTHKIGNNNYEIVDDNNLASKVSGKQDVINDLEDIRSGAAAGATAYQKPINGIPAQDLASEVIPDVSSFITKTVNNLTNYYLKSETYTKTEVQNLIASINHFHYEIAASTSAVSEPQSNVLYLIGPTGTGADKYEEYIYPNSTTGWVKIGDTTIDLSNYPTSNEVSGSLQALATGLRQQIDNKLSKSGGTMTGDINLANHELQVSTNRNGIKFVDNTTGVLVGNANMNTTIQSGNADLKHRKGSTDYVILDTSNVKTINGASLIGSGNLTLEDSSNKTNDIASNSSNTTKYPSCKGVVDYVADQTFVVTCGIDPSDIKHINKTLDDIWAAYSAGKKIRVLFSKASGVVFEEDATILIDGTRRCIVHTVVDGVHYIVTIYEENDTTKFSFETKEDNLFIAEYGVTTENEIYTACDEGKIVIVVYQSIIYYLNNVSNGVTFSGVSNGYTINEITVSGSTWSLLTTSLEKTSDRISSITDDRRESKYPNERAVYDALFVKGVLSQTQTWSGYNPNPRTYVMSNLVMGDIPKYFIDLVADYGVVFNTTTGYFELNGLTDISYEEMCAIYKQGVPIYSSQYMLRSTTDIRTNLFNNSYKGPINVSWFARDSHLEVISFSTTKDTALLDGTYPFYDCVYLKEIKGVIVPDSWSYQGAGASPFGLCYSLESVQFKGIKGSTTFATSPLLSLDSIVYMVENAANTVAIIITLHTTAYQRCVDDTTEYEYNSQTYTGIIALATAKNITIAQAS